MRDYQDLARNIYKDTNRDLEHSDLRRSLYELLNPDVCDEFKLLDTLHQKKNDEFDENEIYKIDSKIQQNYRDIEILMSKFILRFDWENYITFERIASVKGYNFLGYDK